MWQLPQVGETDIKEQTESLGGKEQTETELQSPENMKTTVMADYLSHILHVVAIVVNLLHCKSAL